LIRLNIKILKTPLKANKVVCKSAAIKPNAILLSGILLAPSWKIQSYCQKKAKTVKRIPLREKSSFYSLKNLKIKKAALWF
jgi:hypothetical protein